MAEGEREREAEAFPAATFHFALIATAIAMIARGRKRGMYRESKREEWEREGKHARLGQLKYLTCISYSC